MKLVCDIAQDGNKFVHVALTPYELALLGRGLGRIIYASDSNEKDAAKQLQYNITKILAEV